MIIGRQHSHIKESLKNKTYFFSEFLSNFKFNITDEEQFAPNREKIAIEA